MTLHCIGINHQTASVELRERLTIDPEQLELSGAGWLNGLAMISTCNRIELYASVDEAETGNRLMEHWGNLTNVEPHQFERAIYQYEAHEAVAHLHRVAAGLESMVLGEPQILGQVARANERAIATQAADAPLKEMFSGAIRTGKRARTETRISQNPVSVSSIGVGLIKKQLGDLSSAHVAVIGAGEMAVLALKGLSGFGVGQITVVNRTVEKAQSLASRWGYSAAGLDQLPTLLSKFDAIVTATASTEPILLANDFGGLTQPITLVDLAVPRDIEPAANELSLVTLFDVDALKHEMAEGLAERKKEVPHVEAIIEEELERFRIWERESTVLPTVTALRQQAEQIRQKELARTLKYLGDVDPEMLKHIDKLSQTLVKQLLHRPTKALRDEAKNGTLNGLEETAQKLFDL